MLNVHQNLNTSEFELKLNEAETCHSMGLFNEALSIYQQALKLIPDQDKKGFNVIQNKIDQIQKELANLEDSESQEISSDDVVTIKNSMAHDDDAASIVDKAVALKELGLIREAVDEYEKLLRSENLIKVCQLNPNFSLVETIKDYLFCLLETNSSREAADQAFKIIYKHNLNDQDLSQIQIWLGTELEQRNQRDQALELYEAAAKIDPKNVQIKNKLNTIKSNIANSSRYDYLIKNKLVNTNQLKEALEISKKINKSVEFVLIDRFKIKKGKVGKSLSMHYGCPFREFDPEMPVPFELINNLKKPFLINSLWLPLSWDKTGIEILIDNPQDLQKTDYVKALMNHQAINFSVGIKEDIEKYINHFFDPKAGKASEDILENLDDIIPDIAFEEEEEIEEDATGMDESSSQVVKFVDQVLVTAFRNKASDIHVEPSVISRKTTIRFRTDGVCHEYIQVPNAMAPAIVSRLKILADLDIAERRRPQDGKITLKRKGIQEFELRISTMPTVGRFEDAVLRILTSSGTHTLDEIGLNERNLSVLKKVIARPYGLILCVGPTGSGKTTTLHSALAHVNTPGVKIWTAEDPVEITQAGLRQVQVKPKIGLDFAKIMRGFLRLDPDIIMIGEMRDRETAATAIEASLTGHLVLSTLHTNNAPETLTRLLDMGMNPLNIADAFLAVLAQRLVRRLCPECIEPFHPDKEEFEYIQNDYGAKAFKSLGVEYTSGFELQRSQGCEECSGSGYKGRLGIHELIEGTPDIKILIKKQATSQDLAKQAVKDGMTTLKQDGVHKVFEGITDMSEVRRVCVT
jgi:type II secretory ATPase GspE/PulE/Tfp pilus assembly ATPase PilB-like protein/tetratricopeptide (TPR) repeat protein